MKPMLAYRWEPQDHPAGWWMSEKFDGVRAVWDGWKLVSRSGRTFAAPLWFRKTVPKGVALDGELWFSSGEMMVRGEMTPGSTMAPGGKRGLLPQQL